MENEEILNSIQELYNSEENMPHGKKKVLMAALKLFSEKGVDRTSTSEIAKESGMSEGTIFKYYKSKENLLNSIVDPLLKVVPIYMNEVEEKYTQPFENIDKLEDTIFFILKDRYEFICRNKCAFIIVVNSYLTNHDIREKVTALLKHFIKSMGKIIYTKFEKFDEFNTANSIEDIIRLIVGQMMSYFFQVNFIEKENVNDEEKQLRKISRQIYYALTK